MARRLTDDQRRIVQTLDRPLFVAAGAGSGKSSTLAERVAFALEPGSGENGAPFIAGLDEVLVITFTHAAAEEIKEKIRERLREGGLEEQALGVDSAWISTIHGMCSRILRHHAFDLGLDPRFTVLSSLRSAQLAERATDEVMRDLMDGDAYPELFAAFSARSNRGEDAAATVFGMVRSVRDAAGSALEGFDSVRFPGTVPSVDDAFAHLRDVYERALALGREQKAFGSTRGAQEEENLQANLAQLERYFATAPGARAALAPEIMDACVKPQDAYRKKTMIEVGKELKATYAEAKLVVAFAPMGQRAPEIMEIARMVDQRYRELKDAEGALDNDDLLSRTFAAFRDHPAIAQRYGNKFKLVMVDEFQDTNAQQVKMIELLSGRDACHLTTVGDSQQSIYRFRAADVQVFRDREKSFDAEGEVRLTMNFRSHADVLAFVEKALSEGPLPDFMRLDPCPTRPDGLRARSLPRIDVEVLTTAASGGATAPVQAQAMAALIADRVAERIAAGERPQDVALLLGRMRNLDVYLGALRSRGIDCVVSGGSTFSAAPEVHMVASLVHALANPKDTQSGLFPVLVSGLFSLEADDLCRLGTKVQELNGAYAKRGIDVGLLGFDLPGDDEPSPRLLLAHEVMSRALRRMASWRIEDVIRGVLVESGWVARCELSGADGQARIANALAAARYVGELAHEGGLGPSRAAREFDQWLRESKVGPASLTGGDGGAVKVMTVHASKGLEYPLVAIAECWSSKKGQPIAGITCENTAGMVNATLVPKGVSASMLGTTEGFDPTDRSDLVDWARFLVNASLEGDQAESARLLYVAITRARESAILGMSLKRSSKGVLSPELPAAVVETLFGGELPPVGESTLDYGGSQPARVRHVVLSKGENEAVSSDPEIPGLTLAVEEADDSQEGTPFTTFETRPWDNATESLGSAEYASLREGVFSYSSAHALMQERWQAEVPATSEDARQAGAIASASVPVVDEEDVDAPEALDDTDKATSLGSAFHELAQTMIEAGGDHDEVRLEALSRHWHLSARQHARLVEAITRWEGSDLRREALSHTLVRPEVPFFIAVDSAYGSYVEGAIDLLCTDAGSDEALVVDYKTGDVGLTLDEVRARHEMQANFYAYVMRSQGYRHVSCAFVCVECDRGDGQPVVVRYAFDDANPPCI